MNDRCVRRIKDALIYPIQISQDMEYADVEGNELTISIYLSPEN